MSIYAGICVLGIGCLSLLGWLLNNDILKGFGASLPPMEVGSALAFIFGGASLLLYHYRIRYLHPVPALLAGLTALLGLLSLVEYGLGINPSVDESVVTHLTPGKSSLGRMAISTALMFVLDGLSLGLWHGKRLFHPSKVLALAASFFALFSFCNYLYGGALKEWLVPFGAMALNTSIAACLLNLGILSLDEEHGLTAVIRRPGFGGVMARRLFPAAIVTPMVLGWIRVYGQRLGLYGMEVGQAIHTTLTSLILVVLIWWNTDSIWPLETAKAEAEKEVRRQAELIDQSKDAIITVDGGGRIQSWNRGAEELYGWTSSEAAGQVIHQILGTTSPTAEMDRILEETGRWDGELTHVRRDGKKVTVDSRRVLQRSNGADSRILEINRDITGHREMEAQLRQAQKLECVGQLAGGVAHDFNNILTVISGYANMLLTDKSLPERTQDSAHEIAAGAERAAAITRQLLAFSRRQMTVQQHVLLNDIIVGMEKMLQRLIGENIELTLCLDDDPISVWIDPGHMEQVIMNLVINARDAMPGGGKILVETGYILVDPEYSAAHFGLDQGRYAVLSISDTGIGMSPEVKARIFEPFFTTKEPGQGTGLGLSTVYGIVQQSKGTTLVYSEPGKGATFKILLPATDGPAAQPRSQPRSEAKLYSLRGAETILLAEDEESLRNYIRRILEQNGYKILSAMNGREALDIASKHRATIDLLLTDVIMPEMGGIDLADQFSGLYPEIPVLHMSGYTNRLWNLDTGMNFIQKPFTATALLTQIQNILAAKMAG